MSITTMLPNAILVNQLAALHTELQAGHPVMCTIPSNWGTPPATPVTPPTKRPVRKTRIPA